LKFGSDNRKSFLIWLFELTLQKKNWIEKRSIWYKNSMTERFSSTCSKQVIELWGSAKKNLLGSSSEQKNVARAQCYKTLYIRNSQFFVISWSVCPWQAFLA
jgi:hypothetical protein